MGHLDRLGLDSVRRLAKGGRFARTGPDPVGAAPDRGTFDSRGGNLYERHDLVGSIRLGRVSVGMGDDRSGLEPLSSAAQFRTRELTRLLSRRGSGRTSRESGLGLMTV